MVRLVTFDADTEARVQMVENASREALIVEVLARLERGEPALDWITAAALAVSRSSELPADHHGGPIHPVAGIYAVAEMSNRLTGKDKHLPVLQCVALANKHVNLPSMGPAAMVAFEDLEFAGDPTRVLARLASQVRRRQPRLAERSLAVACRIASPGEVLNCLLDTALKRNSLDDHYLLYTGYAFRALDVIGWQWAEFILRPVVRYLARHHSFDAFGEFTEATISEGIALYDRFHELEALIDKHELHEGRNPLRTTTAETAAIGALADRIGSTERIATLPPVIAQAMGNGLSLEGTVEAISIGGARIFLRSHTANPYDVHVHTGTALRRYLIDTPAVELRHKVLALLGWAWSYEIRYLDDTLTWRWDRRHPPKDGASASALLARMQTQADAVEGYDVTNLPCPVNELVAGEDVSSIVDMADAYVGAGFDVDSLFAMTARLVCIEDASEMHGYKMQQAVHDEYHACREPLRWVHAVCAAKQAAVNASTRPQRVYPVIREAMMAAQAA